MRKSVSLLCLMICILFSACTNRRDGRKGLNVLSPTSSGRAYELLVVIDQDIWERPAGQALKMVLASEVPGLPQPERAFRIMYTSPRNYDATLKLVRNIIVADIRKTYTQTKMKYAKDVYAYPQAILTIQSPDEDSFEDYVLENHAAIVNFFTKVEMNRQIVRLEASHNKAFLEKAKSMFGCEVWIPGELKSTKEGKDFLWAGTNAATGDQNFVIYSYPYTDGSMQTFTKDYFIHKRDSVMKINIPGAREGMYMETDSTFTNVKPLNLKGEYAMEARGLWRIKGDMMGGPYVSLVRVDKEHRRILVTEAFVYSPDKLKRNLIRQMEASLYTLKYPEAKEVKEIPLGGNDGNISE